jgi:hypothetical protein
MTNNPVLGLPLSEVMRSEIALPLQQLLHIYTVGHFLTAYGDPRNQRSIEQCFDTPQQARHAADTVAGWMGLSANPVAAQVPAWWRDERIMDA